jgi:hypothetical protein
MSRVLKIAGLGLGLGLYLWVAAVGSLNRVRAAKRARRRA